MSSYVLIKTFTLVKFTKDHESERDVSVANFNIWGKNYSH